LSLTAVGYDFYLVAFLQPEGGQSELGARPSRKLLHNTTFTFLSSRKRHQPDAFLQASRTKAVHVHPVLQYVKTVQGGYLNLKVFHLGIFELDNLPTFRANEMVMVKTDMSVLVQGGAPLEFRFDCKPVATEKVEGFLYKVWFKCVSTVMQDGHEFLKTDMLFNAEKDLQDGQSVRGPVNPFVFKKTLELPFLLIMNCIHWSTSLL
jgi:hypothetical protein